MNAKLKELGIAIHEATGTARNQVICAAMSVHFLEDECEATQEAAATQLDYACVGLLALEDIRATFGNVEKSGRKAKSKSGRKMSPATKAKISAAMKKLHASK